MNKVKILNDQLETIVAEAARVESELKGMILERDETIKIKDAQIQKLTARLAIYEDGSIPSGVNEETN